MANGVPFFDRERGAGRDGGPDIQLGERLELKRKYVDWDKRLKDDARYIFPHSFGSEPH